ncbi:type III secretion protein (plasmid) [Sinorhizobium garamanticum]|uniref:Type III secretion protein n=1 Tax=Sinorhizobium garamanticum TaxID=680247 RepID=A0ABY8DLG7_9HYPH|nr:YscO family type III secretion system apparatus protein [Sinorhizobium garamanticum]WEX91746.1 type III secretion protein [Sinorhizobium garamanticum]
MTPEAVHRLFELKELRRRRAEHALRVRHTTLDNAVRAIGIASTNLRRWRQDLPRRELALYEPLIGKTAALTDLEAVNAQMVSLRQYEQLLGKRIEKAQAEADLARQEREEAYSVVREAWREVSKFEDLIRTLHINATQEEERSANLESEDFAQGRNSIGREQDDDLSVDLQRMRAYRSFSIIRGPHSAKSRVAMWWSALGRSRGYGPKW